MTLGKITCGRNTWLLMGQGGDQSDKGVVATYYLLPELFSRGGGCYATIGCQSQAEYSSASALAFFPILIKGTKNYST